jgi:hypothetical protein
MKASMPKKSKLFAGGSAARSRKMRDDLVAARRTLSGHAEFLRAEGDVTGAPHPALQPANIARWPAVLFGYKMAAVCTGDCPTLSTDGSPCQAAEPPDAQQASHEARRCWQS